MKKLRRLLSVILAVAMIMPCVYVGAAEAEPRNGYTLTPLMESADGVDAESAFKFTSESDITADELTAALTLDDEPPLTVEQSGEREFLITPAAKLPSNSIIKFRLNREGEDEVTWAFQTSAEFQIVSALPYNTATNVPINSGIEVTFSDAAYSDIDEYFSIEPSIQGKFERHDKTVSFIPLQPLQKETLYTVTVKAGVKNILTQAVIDEDFTLSFETEGDTEEQSEVWMGFYDGMRTFSSDEEQRVQFYINDKENKEVNPDIFVYQMGLNEQAVKDVKRLLMEEDKYWCTYNRPEGIDASSYSRIAEFKLKDTYDAEDNSITLPQKYGEGLYLIEAVYGDEKRQTVVQVSDLAVQTIGDYGGTVMVWVNDIKTQKSCDGAVITDLKTGAEFKTGKDGVAQIENAAFSEGFIVSANGRQCLMPINAGSDDITFASREFWSVFQLDRTLFKTEDTVKFWGAVKVRNGAEPIDYVTVTLDNVYSNDVLSRQPVKVEGGVYSGEFELPALEAGWYSITVYAGSGELDRRNRISSEFINVYDYVKPPYKLEITADKKAVFAGDEINYTIKSSFFEGTPVADTQVTYNAYASGGKFNSSGPTEARTDINGEINLTQKADVSGQGTANFILQAEATLPEIGLVSEQKNVTVFINDIDVDLEAKRDGDRGSISAEVNTITLDRINSDTAKDSSDYKDAPLGGKEITADIYRVYYTSEQIDTGYDYIEKKSYPIYKYTRNEEKIDTVSMTTGADGKANTEFNLRGGNTDSFYAKISCTDQSGKTMSFERYLGRDWSEYYRNAESGSYYLGGEQDDYHIGDEVKLSLKQGERDVTKGGFLYVTMNERILDYSTDAVYSRSFAESFAPNVYVYCFYFSGRDCESGYGMRANIKYAYDEKQLSIELETDKESYLPGEECTVKVKTTDKNGAPKSAAVNLSAVDEALFAIKEYRFNTIVKLYYTGYYTLKFNRFSHSSRLGYYTRGVETAGVTGGGGSNSAQAIPMASELSSVSDEAVSDGIRAEFKDTAAFASIKTDENGMAEYCFTLPDNITSWRLTASAVTDDLYAGNNKISINASKPMFINYTLNDEFLIGDTPSVGVSVYGSALKGGEDVSLSLWREDMPDNVLYGSGKAFERINIPLPEMNEAGEYTLVIKADCAGMSDALKHVYNVYETYRSMNKAVYSEAYPGMSFETADKGMSDIVFTDNGRGKYLSTLFSLRYTSGARLEKLVAAEEADELIETYFPDIYRSGINKDYKLTDYQQEDGGMGILPYAQSDLCLTVKLLPYISDKVNAEAIKDYLKEAYSGENAENKYAALYGLAVLGDTVLSDLNKYVETENRTVLNSIYLALAFEAFGESGKAAEIYSSDIAPNIVIAEPYAYINIGDDKDDILEASSLAMCLASKLDMPEKQGLYEYCVSNRTDDILINLEKLAYTEEAIKNADPQDASIKYDYFGGEHTIDLKNGRSFALRIPNKYMQYFNLKEVNGAVSTVSVVPVPIDTSLADPQITVRRRYYNANDTENSTTEFKQGDLVRVNLWIDYTNKAADGSYQVTDYLPSGLEYVSGSAKIEISPNNMGRSLGRCTWGSVDGQKVTFYDYNGLFNDGVLYYYYARVVSPGGFTAEAPLVQNAYAKDIFTVGESDRITITE